MAALIDVTRLVPDPVTGLTESHLDWCERQARIFASSLRIPLRSQECDDLVSAAMLTLLELAKRFRDRPGDKPTRAASRDLLFRATAFKFLRYACIREVTFLRSGGTFYGHQPRRRFAVTPLSRCEVGHLHEHDGRRPTHASLLDALIETDATAVPLPFPLTPALVLAVVMTLDLPPLTHRSVGTSGPQTPDQRALSEEYSFWLNLLHQHGFSKSFISRLLGVCYKTVGYYTGKPRPSRKRGLTHATEAA